MVRECSQEEQTRTYTNEEGKEIEIYIPKEDAPEEELFKRSIQAGINFSKYDNIPVQVTGENVVKEISSFEEAGSVKTLKTIVFDQIWLFFRGFWLLVLLKLDSRAPNLKI